MKKIYCIILLNAELFSFIIVSYLLFEKAKIHLLFSVFINFIFFG